jgi:hypothetical protein
MSVWSIIAAYWGAALLCGVVLAILKPLSAWRRGAFAVGALVGSCAYATVALFMPEASHAPWWLPLIPGVIGGGGLGIVWFDDAPGH